MDLASFAGADFRDLDLAGKTYRIFELRLRQWAPLQAWIKANVPGPLSSLGSADFKNLPAELKRDVLAEALQQDRISWPPAPGTKAWFAALDHPGGHAELLRTLLGVGQPVDSAECEDLAEKLSIIEILPAVLAGLGLFGPKSPAPDAPTTTTAGASSATASATSPTRSRRRGTGRKTKSST